jgi:hypothetical protein
MLQWWRYNMWCFMWSIRSIWCGLQRPLIFWEGPFKLVFFFCERSLCPKRLGNCVRPLSLQTQSIRNKVLLYTHMLYICMAWRRLPSVTKTTSSSSRPVAHKTRLKKVAHKTATWCSAKLGLFSNPAPLKEDWITRLRNWRIQWPDTGQLSGFSAGMCL